MAGTSARVWVTFTEFLACLHGGCLSLWWWGSQWGSGHLAWVIFLHTWWLLGPWALGVWGQGVCIPLSGFLSHLCSGYQFRESHGCWCGGFLGQLAQALGLSVITNPGYQKKQTSRHWPSSTWRKWQSTEPCRGHLYYSRERKIEQIG